jgi:hypothetical protein
MDTMTKLTLALTFLKMAPVAIAMIFTALKVNHWREGA